MKDKDIEKLKAREIELTDKKLYGGGLSAKENHELNKIVNIIAHEKITDNKRSKRINV